MSALTFASGDAQRERQKMQDGATPIVRHGMWRGQHLPQFEPAIPLLWLHAPSGADLLRLDVAYARAPEAAYRTSRFEVTAILEAPVLVGIQVDWQQPFACTVRLALAVPLYAPLLHAMARTRQLALTPGPARTVPLSAVVITLDRDGGDSMARLMTFIADATNPPF